MLKRTPLFATHQKLGARLVDFGGWEMPVQYSSIIEEHQAVRTAAGLFDISHMGEFFISGLSAEAYLNFVLTNDVRRLAEGQAQYTLMCNFEGGVIDDLYLYRLGDFSYLAIVNASRIDADFAWMKEQLKNFSEADRVQVTNISGGYGALALQGPRVVDFVDACFGSGFEAVPKRPQPSELKRNEVGSVAFSIGQKDHGGFIARTGYTGEDGFEVIAPAEIIEFVWNKVMNLGAPYGIKPAGLGARDTLRTEMGYSLYGHELDEKTTPVEAGLGNFVAWEKPDFIGRKPLLTQRSSGAQKKCVAFKMTERSALPRPHYAILGRSKTPGPIGEVTSGTLSPSLGIGIGLGFVTPEFAKVGTPIEIEIRGKPAAAEIVSKPIYKKAI